MKQIQFRLTAYTDAAGKRNEELPLYGNEDNFFVDADLSNDKQGNFSTDECQKLSEYGSLLVVADGMGGMNAGEVASDIAINTVKKFFAPGKLQKDLLADCKSRERYMERVVLEADAAIKAHSREHAECEGMGSTIVMVWICGDSASLTWCGDSRAYLFREPLGIVQVSKDHSYVQSLVDDGKITDDEAFDHPYGNIITRSLGDPEKKAQPDSRTIKVYKGDIFLVCSDGLSGVLRDRKSFDSDGNPRDCGNLEDIIRNNRSSMLACREALWEAAEKAEWYDNVTAILYEITDGEKAPAGESLDPNDNAGMATKSFINIRVSKKNMLLGCICLLILAAAACGFFMLRKKKAQDSEWKVRIENVGRKASDNNLTFVSGMLQELTHGDTVGLAGIEKIIAERISVLELMNSIKESNPERISDSLYSKVSDCDSVDIASLRSGLEKIFAEIIADKEGGSKSPDSNAGKKTKAIDPGQKKQKEADAAIAKEPEGLTEVKNENDQER